MTRCRCCYLLLLILLTLKLSLQLSYTNLVCFSSVRFSSVLFNLDQFNSFEFQYVRSHLLKNQIPVEGTFHLQFSQNIRIYWHSNSQSESAIWQYGNITLWCSLIKNRGGSVNAAVVVVAYTQWANILDNTIFQWWYSKHILDVKWLLSSSFFQRQVLWFAQNGIIHHNDIIVKDLCW